MRFEDIKPYLLTPRVSPSILLTPHLANRRRRARGNSSFVLFGGCFFWLTVGMFYLFGLIMVWMMAITWDAFVYEVALGWDALVFLYVGVAYAVYTGPREAIRWYRNRNAPPPEEAE